jgi:hypothetical protein
MKTTRHHSFGEWLNQAQLHGNIKNGLRWSAESREEVLLEGDRPTSPRDSQTIPTWPEPLSGIGAPSGKRELQRWLFTAASTLALRQNAIVRLKLDYPGSFHAWLLKPGRKPVRVYRPEQVRCPFIELRVNARSWLPPLNWSEEKAAQASCQLESFLRTARKVHLSRHETIGTGRRR